jgi:Glutathione S-transferase, N-terminal domain
MLELLLSSFLPGVLLSNHEAKSTSPLRFSSLSRSVCPKSALALTINLMPPPSASLISSSLIKTLYPSMMSTANKLKPLLLYAADTPNGRKVSIHLEELKDVYGLEYECILILPCDPSPTDSRFFFFSIEKINLGKLTQKEPWFLALNPNGRIPVLVDRSRNNFVVFETSAILLYLSQHYDKEYKFWFKSDDEDGGNDYSRMLQWMFFSHGGIGPMQGQCTV